jgi:rSAM/selenodomain-associated transferase 2
VKLSIVIPVLDDAPALTRLLEQIRALWANDVEVLVVDGGSRDGSAAVAARCGATLLTAPRGRARQLATGVAAARGDWLWLLHADSSVPVSVAASLDRVLAAGVPAWGRFDVRLSGADWRLRWVESLMNLRSRVTGIATGDQAMFAHRALLDAAGGVPDLPLMEDVELSRRLKRIAAPLCLRERIVTSSRRWERDGVFRTILLMWRLRLLYALGADPRRLHRAYYGE